MAKRGSEPDEALGPAINGLELMEMRPAPEESDADEPEYFQEPEQESEPEPEPLDPVFLICGTDMHAHAAGSLAAACGFLVEMVSSGGEEESGNDFSFAEKKHEAPEFDDIVNICAIERNFFVGIFGQDEETSVKILAQCLLSPARYLGLDASEEEKARIFVRLKAGGAPDTELAAICCPIGLNIVPDSPDQFAVAVVAEMLAAKNGTLKRLRHED